MSRADPGRIVTVIPSSGITGTLAMPKSARSAQATMAAMTSPSSPASMGW
jgi:hypothetical protein